MEVYIFTKRRVCDELLEEHPDLLKIPLPEQLEPMMMSLDHNFEEKRKLSIFRFHHLFKYEDRHREIENDDALIKDYGESSEAKFKSDTLEKVIQIVMPEQQWLIQWKKERDENKKINVSWYTSKSKSVNAPSDNATIKRGEFLTNFLRKNYVQNIEIMVYKLSDWFSKFTMEEMESCKSNLKKSIKEDIIVKTDQKKTEYKLLFCLMEKDILDRKSQLKINSLQKNNDSIKKFTKQT